MKKILMNNIQDTVIVTHDILGFREGQPLTLVDHFKYVDGAHAFVKVFISGTEGKYKFLSKKYVKIIRAQG